MAKYKEIIMSLLTLCTGNRTLLKYDDNWKRLIDKYECNGCISPERKA